MALTVQEATELSRNATSSLRNGQNPFANTQAPESAAGGVIPKVQNQPEQNGTAQVTPTEAVKPVEGAAVQTAVPEPVDVEKQIAAVEAQIAELKAKTPDTETPKGGTVSDASQVTQPVTQPTAGPQTVDVSADTMVRTPDGSVKSWKEIERERSNHNKHSQEMRKLHEDRATLEKEQERITKITASPVGKVLIAGLEAGLSPDKVIESGAAIIGKTFSQTQEPEPEIPKPSDPEYEEKLEKRSMWAQAQQNKPLLDTLARLEAELKELKKAPEPPTQSIAEQNQKLFSEVILSRLPQGLSQQQQERIREHLVQTGEQIDVPVDDYSWNRKLLTPDALKALYLGAFPNNQIPANLTQQPVQQATAPALPQSAMASELNRLQSELLALRQSAGLAPPALPAKPISEAGPQPAAAPDAEANRAPLLNNRDAEQKVREFSERLKKR
jgi:hypothetical protein